MFESSVYTHNMNLQFVNQVSEGTRWFHFYGTLRSPAHEAILLFVNHHGRSVRALHPVVPVSRRARTNAGHATIKLTIYKRLLH